MNENKIRKQLKRNETQCNVIIIIIIMMHIWYRKNLLDGITNYSKSFSNIDYERKPRIIKKSKRILFCDLRKEKRRKFVRQYEMSNEKL